MVIKKSCLPESPLPSKYSINDRDTESFTKVSRGVMSPGDEAPGTNMGPGNRKRNSS